jgi:uncharacterized protein HemX
MGMQEPVVDPTQVRRALTVARVALALGVVSLLLVAAFGTVGYAVLSGRIHDVEKKTNENRSRITDNESRISANAAALEESGKAQVADLKSTLTALTRRVNRINDCLPELKNVVDSLSIQTSDTNGYLTGAYITNNLQISRVCQQVLSPTTSNAPGE